MDKSNGKKISIQNILNIKNAYQIMLIVIVVLVVNQLFVENKQHEKFNYVGVDYSKGWKDAKGKIVNLDELNTIDGYKAGNTIKIKKRIDSSDINVLNNDSLCFMSDNVLVTGYINGKEIIKTEGATAFFACKSPGTKWNFYHFNKNDIGKELQLNIRIYYSDSSSMIKYMKIADAKQYCFQYLKEQLLFLMIYAIMIVAAVGYIVSGWVLRAKDKASSQLLISLGWAAMCLSIWSIVDIRILHMFFKLPGILQSISCGTLFAISIPVIHIFKEMFNVEDNKGCNILVNCIYIINCIVWILNCAGIKDLHETLVLCHIMLGFTAGYLIFIIVKELKKQNWTISKENKKEVVIKGVVVLLVCIGIIVDIIRYYKGILSHGISFIFIDMIIVIAYCAIIAYSRIALVSVKLRHGEFVSKLAYMDGLTEVYNRTSYKEKIKAIKKGECNNNKIGIVVFDLNDLKVVNDTYGHIEGDNMIVAFADILKKTFEDQYVYRIGGDEFAVIIDAPNSEMVYKVGVMQLKNNINNYNNFYLKKYSLSTSSGAAFYDKTKNMNIEHVIKEADKLMYEEKRKIKKQKQNNMEV